MVSVQFAAPDLSFMVKVMLPFMHSGFPALLSLLYIHLSVGIKINIMFIYTYLSVDIKINIMFIHVYTSVCRYQEKYIIAGFSIP